MSKPEVIAGQFGGKPYRELGALQEELLRVIREHGGTVPVAGVLGVLRFIEYTLLQETTE